MATARTHRLSRDEETRLREDPHLHEPRLVLSHEAHEHGALDRLADLVSRLVGSMWTFVVVTTAIVVWLFAGNVVGFDRTPWPLLLTVLNLPQLSIMISLQVSANRAQAASDARAIAAYETLIALSAINRKQLAILQAQDRIMATQSRTLEALRQAADGAAR